MSTPQHSSPTLATLLIAQRDHLRSAMDAQAMPDPVYSAVMALLNAGDFALEAAEMLVAAQSGDPAGCSDLLRFASPEQAIGFATSKLAEATQEALRADR